MTIRAVLKVATSGSSLLHTAAATTGLAAAISDSSAVSASSAASALSATFASTV